MIHRIVNLHEEEYISYAKGVLGDAPFLFFYAKFNAYFQNSTLTK